MVEPTSKIHGDKQSAPTVQTMRTIVHPAGTAPRRMIAQQAKE